ncbi:hypothetical protein ACQEUX_03890 [Micromonospora sp. CA-259024]|uniref:hypothetical protein n=1 Tax=Micromonospora sp. CA-259024 TaxID=3239965 RepID=UPI003D90E045
MIDETDVPAQATAVDREDRVGETTAWPQPVSPPTDDPSERVDLPSGNLSSDQATALLVGWVGAARVRHEADAVERLVRLCEYLPLTVSLAAALLRADTTRAVADLACDLGRTRDRLPGQDASALAVAATFEVSYRDLSAGRQRLLRYLGLHPGPDFDVYAAGALGNLTLVHARQGLADLRDRRLLTATATTGRYRLPAPIADHVGQLASTEPAVSRNAALDRLRDCGQEAARVRRLPADPSVARRRTS